MAIRAWTDYPITELGDKSYAEAPVREVSVLSWDRGEYCEILVQDRIISIKRRYVYVQPGRSEQVPPLPRRVLYSLPRTGTIFVFGSNLAGRHGKGAALDARRDYGAKLGVGTGRTGNAYAIPTKDASLKSLPLDVIRGHVHQFLRYARAHPELRFFVTAIGTGLAGKAHADMAPMFSGAPENCELPRSWMNILMREEAR